MALRTYPLIKAAHFVEPINRLHHRFALVIQQQRTVHQTHRTLTALALAPALRGANHLAAVQIDVEAPITKSALDFT
ncbi:hypothetical protein D3C71_2159850 [compost metagenome]